VRNLAQSIDPKASGASASREITVSEPNSVENSPAALQSPLVDVSLWGIAR